MESQKKLQKGDCKVIRQLSCAANKLEAKEANRARERFFASLARRAIDCTLRGRNDAQLVEEVQRSFLCDVREVPDDSSDFLTEEFLQEPTALGWAYQAWNTHRRDVSSWAVSKRAESRNENVDIASVTQLFTDRYIADFIVSRCVDLWSPASSAPQSCPSLCDPAVGAGHLLVSAVAGCAARGISVDTLAYQIFGYDIDPQCTFVARIAVFCELIRAGFSGDVLALCNHLRQAVRVLEQPYGSLDRRTVLCEPEHGFDIVIANPPYLGRRKLPVTFRQFLDSEYPATSIDLCAAFLQRCVELLAADGMLGVVASDKWIRLKQYSSLRGGSGAFRGLYKELTIDGIYDLGERAFSPAAGVHDGMKVAVLVGRKAIPSRDHRVIYAGLSVLTTQSDKERELRVCGERPEDSKYVTVLRQSQLAAGGDVFLKTSGLPERFSRLMYRVKDRCDVIVGVQTSDDSKFVRYIWQLPDDRTGWRVHCKGGGYSRWGGLARWAIDWRAGGETFLGSSVARERAEKWASDDGWVYSWFANGSLGVRRKHSGWSFGRAAAGGVFVNDKRLVAFLNSRIASAAVRGIGGKIQLPEGTVKSIPVPTDLGPIDEQLVALAVDIKERIAAAELTEALFQSGQIPCLEELLALEAFLLTIEACLEDQVECSLEFNRAESMELVERLGMMAGWYAPSLSPDQYPVFEFLPEQYRGLLPHYISSPRSRLTEGSLHVSQPQIEAIMLSGRGASAVDGRWIFPPSGVVERVCRELRVHPFDALSAICDVLRHPGPVSRKVYGNHLAKCVLDEVLSRLGFQWWNSPRNGIGRVQAALTFDEVVSLAEKLLRKQRCIETFGPSMESWIAEVFAEWQERYFFGESPLMVQAGTAHFRTVALRPHSCQRALVA